MTDKKIIPLSGTWVFVLLGKAETNTLTRRWDTLVLVYIFTHKALGLKSYEKQWAKDRIIPYLIE